MEYWDKESKDDDDKNRFSDAAATFFKADETGWNCGDVEMGCDQKGVVCQDSQTSNMTGPAGPLILASFANVSAVSPFHNSGCYRCPSRFSNLSSFGCLENESNVSCVPSRGRRD